MLSEELKTHIITFDTITFAQTFTLLAEEKKFGTCYLGTTLTSLKSISDALELPQYTVLKYPQQLLIGLAEKDYL